MTTPQPMSAAEYWWNHLSFEQHEFIRADFKEFHKNDLLEIYNNQNYWTKLPGWPETTRQQFEGL
jgi:hypothetical protein